MGVLIDRTTESRILAHYDLVGAAVERHFAGAPIVFTNFPGGFEKPPHWHRTDIPLSRNKLLWLCHRMFAVEFYSWAPLPADLDRLRFARILLESPTNPAQLRLAALTLRALLAMQKLEAAPVLDGGTGFALWIPFADAPRAEAVRAWLHEFCASAVRKHPDLFTNEPNTHDTGRVHLHVSSNAPGHFSALPYSVRGDVGLGICTPITWNELATLDAAPAIDAFASRFQQLGDVFGTVLSEIPAQHFAKLIRPLHPAPMIAEPRGSAITAALEILGDGKARDAQQILDEALKRKLVQPNMTKKYVYTALIEYIARSIGRGRKPLIAQNEDRSFRINQPADDWPDFGTPSPQSAPDAVTSALLDRLDASATGDDPAAFEIAVCDAFAHLGFAATHVGGRAAPDGYADAQLGALGYRLMLECKTAKGVVTEPDCAEASKYREPYNADLCALVGPDFSDEQELTDELHTHQVTAITVADLRALICMRATPLEIRNILKPGFATDYLSDLLWERAHGPRKRIAVVAHLIRQEGWKAQVTAAQQGGPATAPLLTVDAAMLLVDAALRDAGSTRASTRDEVEAAFSHLTDPLIGDAVWTDASHTSIIITHAP